MSNRAIDVHCLQNKIHVSGTLDEILKIRDQSLSQMVELFFKLLIYVHRTELISIVTES